MGRARLRRFLCAGVVAVLALALSAVAPAAASSPTSSARVDPPVATAKVSQLFTLVVEPEEEDAVISMVEFYPPPDFEIGSFAPAPGWHRDWTIQSAETTLQKAVWTRGDEPRGKESEEEREEEFEEAAEEDAVFQFVALPQSSKRYAFEVRATYSDGSVIHWRGADSVAFPPSSAGAQTRPPPTLLATSLESPVATSAPAPSAGGSSTLALVALIVGALGLIVGVVALVASRGASRTGGRPS